MVPSRLIELSDYYISLHVDVGLQAMYEEATEVANDAVSCIRTVASFCAEHKVTKAYYEKCEAPVRQGIRQGIVSGLGFGISFFVLYSTYALCFYVGAKFMLDGKATFTEVFRVSKLL